MKSKPKKKLTKRRKEMLLDLKKKLDTLPECDRASYLKGWKDTDKKLRGE